SRPATCLSAPCMQRTSLEGLRRGIGRVPHTARRADPTQRSNEVMPQTVKGVIARAKGELVELVDIVVPDPGPGEAVVKVEACGVCHTDLHYREGGINDEFPFLLGHEAAGVV